MQIFNPKNAYHYIIAFAVIFIVSHFLTKMRKSAEDTNPNSDIIREYLLNESPLYGYNRPKLWIHSKYEMNARKWKDFYSRNTTDLNQPYIHLSIKSIINHCGDDFNICLIDDESFSNLLPNWDIELHKMPDPARSQYRELGMFKILQLYGGLVIPNSFVCIKNLKSFYEDGVRENKPFVCENVNKIGVSSNDFIPITYIMGTMKNDDIIIEMIEKLDNLLSTTHAISNKFVEDVSRICIQYIQDDKMNLIGGENVGVKSTLSKPILIDNLMNESYLDLDSSAVGIYIPSTEVLRRSKYQWFALLTAEQILETNSIISKYLMASLVDCSIDNKSKVIKSVVSI